MLPKLVRDFIPKIIAEEQKRVPYSYRADDEEYWNRLKEKLLEEVNEFINSKDDISELADILEVIEAIISFKKISFDEITIIKNKKAQSHGAFNDRIILYSVKES